MFLHNLKYELMTALRVKDLLVWLILFPMVLGTLFKISFGSIYDTVERFSAIPTAVVETEKDEILHQVLESVSEGDNAFLKLTFTNEEEATELLRKGEVTGILTVEYSVSLTVKEEGIAQTILQNFVERYNATVAVMTDCVKENPESAKEVAECLKAEIQPVTQIPLTEGNTDYFTEYFYNLIAMVAMYGSLTGLHITIQNQGNLSKLGARKCCSPTPKYISTLACLTGSFLTQTICMAVSVSFLRFVLGINFGSRLPLVYLAAIVGGFLGVAFGFCIGSIGRFETGLKTGICFGVSMFFCFCSGLMVGNMKGIVSKYVPWFNKINPTALLSDAFYYLNIDSDLRRFRGTMLSMIAISAVFILIGFMLTRRKKYASV